MNDFKKGQIISIAKGGIGNQLFIFSAGKSLAENLGYEHLIESEIGFHNDSYNRSYLLKHLNISSKILEKNSKSFTSLRSAKHKLLRTYNKFLPLNFRSYISESHGITAENFNKLDSCRKKIYLNGYWCSEDYFFKHDKIIAKELKIPNPNDSLNLSILEKIQRSPNPTFIHVRRENYHPKLGIEYYAHAINRAQSCIANSSFFLFSDDFEWAKTKLKDLVPFTAIEHNARDELADLWLMSHCKHAIIANSTFSWWGAWLGQRKENSGLIIAPDNKAWSLGIPARWKKLMVKS